jgi:hypothetical protein|uniref:Uncharacterized protein n=1 Tax=viral metagenome TaxID=1070528 RepID=A0A6C0IY43_9ZZZZ
MPRGAKIKIKTAGGDSMNSLLGDVNLGLSEIIGGTTNYCPETVKEHLLVLHSHLIVIPEMLLKNMKSLDEIMGDDRDYLSCKKNILGWLDEYDHKLSHEIHECIKVIEDAPISPKTLKVKLDDKVRKTFIDEKTKVKHSKTVEYYLGLCNRLLDFKKKIKEGHIGFIAKLVESFDLFGCPIQHLYELLTVDGMKSQSYQILIEIVQIGFDTAYGVYQFYTSADINSDDIANKLFSQLETLKSHPELRSCGELIDGLVSSGEMFKSGFSGYYRDFTETDNPMSFLTGFAGDVCKSQTDPKRSARQMRQSVIFGRFLRKQLQRTKTHAGAKTGLIEKILDGVTKTAQDSIASDVTKKDKNMKDDEWLTRRRELRDIAGEGKKDTIKSEFGGLPVDAILKMFSSDDENKIGSLSEHIDLLQKYIKKPGVFAKKIKDTKKKERRKKKK